MKLFLPGPKTRSGRRLAGFLVLSLSAHAVAFSLFRDPGDFAPIPPPSPGKVLMAGEDEWPGGYARIFEPSAIVFPAAPPPRLTEGVILPWQDTSWSALTPVAPGSFRPAQIGTDAPLPVRAGTALGQVRGSSLFRTAPARGRPVPGTWWEITGELSKRKRTSTGELPAMRTAQALEPTLARIGVDEDGAVRFVFLEGTSGDPAVDREASSLLRAWRFEPAPGQWIQWGRVRVLWSVEPPTAGGP